MRGRAAVVDNNHNVLELRDDVLVPVVADLDVDHLRAGPAVDTEEHQIVNFTGVVHVRGTHSEDIELGIRQADRRGESVYALCMLTQKAKRTIIP